MGDFGYTQALWFKEAASYGAVTTMSTATQFVLPVKPASFKKVINRIKTEHIRGVAGVKQEEDQIGIESVEGTFEFAIPCSSAAWDYLVKHLTGKIDSTGSVGDYVHTARWNDKLFVGLSFAQNKAGKTYAYHGCQIESLKVNCKVGGMVLGTITIVGKSEEQLALQTAPSLPSLHTTPYYLFQHGAFTIDTVAEAITEIEVTFTRMLAKGDEESYALGSVGRALLPSTGYGATGVIKRRHDNDSTHVSKFYAKYLAGSVGAIALTFTSPSDVSFKFLINLGVVKFEGETPNPDGPAWTKETAPFTAYDMDQSTSSIVIYNDSNQAFAATGTYDGAGA